MSALDLLADIAKDRANFCAICRRPLDVTAPHAIMNHDYAHLECADKFDSRDLGAVELPDACSVGELAERDDFEALADYVE